MDRGSRGLSSRGGHCQCVRAILISVVCVAGSPLPMDFMSSGELVELAPEVLVQDRLTIEFQPAVFPHTSAGIP